jgi:CRISPR-associated exonuclease Cas4
MTSESDREIAISGLQHLVYCERQAALIHVERIWQEDASTVHGRILHQRADDPGRDRRRGVRVERGVTLRSRRLGLFGRADAVELRADKASPRGWIPFPVETKRGAARSRLADQVQLCAQALCLEEMTGVEVPSGALFYAQSHRRVEVSFDGELRQTTEDAARRLRELIERGETPPPVPAPRCRGCSLASLCLPFACGDPGRARRHLEAIFREGP